MNRASPAARPFFLADGQGRKKGPEIVRALLFGGGGAYPTMPGNVATARIRAVGILELPSELPSAVRVGAPQSALDDATSGRSFANGLAPAPAARVSGLPCCPVVELPTGTPASVDDLFFRLPPHAVRNTRRPSMFEVKDAKLSYLTLGRRISSLTAKVRRAWNVHSWAFRFLAHPVF